MFGTFRHRSAVRGVDGSARERVLGNMTRSTAYLIESDVVFGAVTPGGRCRYSRKAARGQVLVMWGLCVASWVPTARVVVAHWCSERRRRDGGQEGVQTLIE